MSIVHRDEQLDSGFHYCEEHTAKMDGMVSISTSCLDNPICQARRRVKGSVCEHCFAAALLKRPSNRQCYRANTFRLTARLYDLEELPFINAFFMRIESFGDVQNVWQARNYVRIMKRNRHCNFGAWSKNPDIWSKAFELEGGKPSNCSFVLSSMMLDVVADASPWPFVDHVFTVWTSEEACEAAGYHINCAKRSCITCHKCYMHDGPFLIHEILK